MGCSSSAIETKESFEKSISMLEPVTTTNKISAFNINTQNLIGSEKESIKKKYKVIEKIGAGAFGKVYKVRNLITQQLRAMKMIKKDSINYQDDSREFLKEIEILSKIDHPNIIKIFEYFLDDVNYYIITELCEGGELIEQLYKMHHFTEHQAAIIMEQVFSAVFYIHSKGIVHRDLKPENILIETNNLNNYKNMTKSEERIQTVKSYNEIEIKLIDFGTSNYCAGKLTYKIGTPYYIAPEVLNKSYSNKCDLWSCGVILYILLSGTPPFYGEDDQEIMENVRKGKFSFDHREFDSISQEAKNLITNLLRYDPIKRITAEEAWNDIWIQKYSKKRAAPISTNINNATSYKIPINNLKSFASRQKFQQATIAFLVHQISSSDMVKDLRKIFKEFDVNGDGQLSYNELKAGFKRYFVNEDVADAEFDILIKKIDLDNNNYIEYEEFLRVCVNVDVLITEQNLKLAFDFFDKDKSGKLSPEEIKSVLGVHESENIDIIKNIISEVDINNDGLISFEEFKHLMQNVVKDKNI